MHVRDVRIWHPVQSISCLGRRFFGRHKYSAPFGGAGCARRVLCDGDDVTGKLVRERSVAGSSRQFINYPVMTVYENIASPLRVRGVAKAEIECEAGG